MSLGGLRSNGNSRINHPVEPAISDAKSYAHSTIFWDSRHVRSLKGVTIHIRPALPADLDAVLRLWDEAEAELSHTADVDGLSRLIERDPGAMLVPKQEARSSARSSPGGTVGADRSTAWPFILIIDVEAWPGALLSEAEMRLADLGARRLQAIVVESDPRAVGFWRASDWSEQVERLRFVKG